MKPAHYDDPVAAYDQLAAHYAGISRKREPYLRGVEHEIISRIPPCSRSILDLGAGDGSRSLRLASQSGIERIVLVEPSKEMASKSAEHAEVWPIRAENLDQQCIENVGTAAPDCPVERSSTSSPDRQEDRFGARKAGSYHISEQFDVITCLWNVLGHIPSAENRLRSLCAVAQLLSPNGKFFLDVTHRYNFRAYGIVPTCGRWIRDQLFPSEHNGNVVAKWTVDEFSISTYGHVFTHREIMCLTAAAGLEPEEQIVIDYENGKIRRFGFQGNLLYVFRRSSRIDSSSAPQTS